MAFITLQVTAEGNGKENTFLVGRNWKDVFNIIRYTVVF
jgi:hypothetical protein